MRESECRLHVGAPGERYISYFIHIFFLLKNKFDVTYFPLVDRRYYKNAKKRLSVYSVQNLFHMLNI